MTAEKERAYKTVYNDLMRCGLFAGRYDAKNGNEHFMYGVLTVMDVIAKGAGQLDEYERLSMHNMLESEEKAR